MQLRALCDGRVLPSAEKVTKASFAIDPSRQKTLFFLRKKESKMQSVICKISDIYTFWFLPKDEKPVILPWYHGLFYILFCGEHVFSPPRSTEMFWRLIFLLILSKNEESARTYSASRREGGCVFSSLLFFMFSETDGFRPEDAGDGRGATVSERRFRFLLLIFCPLHIYSSLLHKFTSSQNSVHNKFSFRILCTFFSPI